MFGSMGLGCSAKGGALETDFISTWRTTTDLESITMPTYSLGTYDCAIDWGDGTITNPTTYNDAGMTHEYAIAGDYEVRISGTFSAIYCYGAISKLNLISVSNLGHTGLNNLKYGFRDASNMTSFVCGDTDTSLVTDMLGMFYASQATILDVSGFDTSLVTDMSYMFYGSQATVLDVSGFDTSNVTNMLYMFRSSLSTVLDVSGFDTSKVTDMQHMFYASQATVLDVSGFNTSLVTNMTYMFHYTKATVLDFSGFDTANVTNMFSMFRITADTEYNLSNFDTSKVTTMQYMFYDSYIPENVGIEAFDITNLTNATDMIRNSSLSTSTYDATLIAWEAQVRQATLTLINFGASTYTLGSAAETARSALIASGITINDGGGI